MGDVTRTELGWPAIAFVFAIALFGVVLVGRTPTWPIYVTILACGVSQFLEYSRGPTPAQKTNSKMWTMSNSPKK
jgi:hypothetical protein